MQGEPMSKEREKQVETLELKRLRLVEEGTVTRLSIPCPPLMEAGSSEWRDWALKLAANTNMQRSAQATGRDGKFVGTAEEAALYYATRQRVSNENPQKEEIFTSLTTPLEALLEAVDIDRNPVPHKTAYYFVTCLDCETTWIGTTQSGHRCPTKLARDLAALEAAKAGDSDRESAEEQVDDPRTTNTKRVSRTVKPGWKTLAQMETVTIYYGFEVLHHPSFKDQFQLDQLPRGISHHSAHDILLANTDLWRDICDTLPSSLREIIFEVGEQEQIDADQAGTTSDFWRADVKRKHFCEHQAVAQLLWILEPDAEGQLVETRVVGELGDSDRWGSGRAAKSVLKWVRQLDFEVSH